MKTTQKRNMGFGRTLFLMVMLSLVAVFGLVAGGAPAGAGIPAAPAASGGYTQATLLAAFNAATSVEQVKALFTEANFALLGSNNWRTYSNAFSEADKTRAATVVFNNGTNYASFADLQTEFRDAINAWF
jgi:hypothetical protein